MSLNEWLNKKRNEAVVQDERVREIYIQNLFNQARSFNSNVTPKEQKTDEVLADIFNNISKLSNEIDAQLTQFIDLENLRLEIEAKQDELGNNGEIIDVDELRDRFNKIVDDNLDSLEAIPYYYNLVSNKFNLILKNKLDKSQTDKFNAEMDFILKQLINLSDLYETNPSIKAKFIDKKILNELIQNISDRSYKPIKFIRDIKLREDRDEIIEEERDNGEDDRTILSSVTSQRAPSIGTIGTQEIADFASVEPGMIRRLREGRGKKRGGMKKGLPESEDMILSDFKNNILENKKKKMINLYDDRKNTPYID
jgi:hypothetical protein